jgi:hypothetical protein
MLSIKMPPSVAIINDIIKYYRNGTVRGAGRAHDRRLPFEDVSFVERTSKKPKLEKTSKQVKSIVNTSACAIWRSRGDILKLFSQALCHLCLIKIMTFMKTFIR